MVYLYYHAWDTPFWSGTLNLEKKTPKTNQKPIKNSKNSEVNIWHSI